MADTHKLEIFRGLIKFKSNTQKIWGVLILLSIITAIEVVLGIYKPASLEAHVLGMKINIYDKKKPFQLRNGF